MYRGDTLWEYSMCKYTLVRHVGVHTTMSGHSRCTKVIPALCRAQAYAVHHATNQRVPTT